MAKTSGIPRPDFWGEGFQFIGEFQYQQYNFTFLPSLPYGFVCILFWVWGRWV